MDLEEASAAVSLKVVRILGEVRNRLKLRIAETRSSAVWIAGLRSMKMLFILLWATGWNMLVRTLSSVNNNLSSLLF